MNERIPLFVSGRVLYLKKDWLAFENCMLPLQNAAAEVNMILGVTIYTYPSTKSGRTTYPPHRSSPAICGVPEFR